MGVDIMFYIQKKVGNNKWENIELFNKDKRVEIWRCGRDAWEIINEEQNRKTIGLLLKKLKPQARKVIELRYGFNNCEPHTRDERCLYSPSGDT